MWWIYGVYTTISSCCSVEVWVEALISANQFSATFKISSTFTFNHTCEIQARIMAVQPALERAHTDPLDEELNDGQIEELLARATARLQSKAATKPTKPASRATKSSSSKFDTRALDGNHALINGEVSKINTASLTDAKVTKNKADGMRVVQDPVAMKRMAEEVCHTTCFLG